MAGHRHYIHAAIQRLCNFQNAVLSHPIRDEIRTGIEQDRTLHLIRPVIIVRQPPQARLDPAEDDRCLLKGSADEVRIDDCRMIGPFSGCAARRVAVGRAPFLIHRVMVNHRIHIAAAHEKRKARFTEYRDALI